MKRILIVVCICLIACTIIAQNKYIDSIKIAMAHTTEPIDRFDQLNKIREDFNRNQEGIYDTSSAIEMYRIAQELNNDSLLAISYDVIGNVLSDKGAFPAAMEYFFKGIPLAERSKDKRRISSIYIDIAFAYYSLKNFEEGLKYTRLAGKNLPDRSSAMYDYMAVQFNRNMMRYFLNKNQPDSALIYLHEIEDINRRLKSPFFKTIELALGGKAYGQLGEDEMAEIYFKKANNLADSTNSFAIKITVKNNNIPFLLNRSNIQEAKLQALELITLGNKRDDIKLAAAGYLRRIYDSLHRIDSAYYYAIMELSIKDSIFSQNNINKLQVLAFNETIRRMEEANRLADEAEQRQQNIQFALIALGIISFIIIFLLLSRSIITNTKMIAFLGVVALLIVFEFLNLLLHPFLERVTHHSPVLMLLALVCIAALLVPLHHKVEKWATAKLVEKNKQVRLAAAKKTIEQLERQQEQDNEA
jgi:tetratricopeptide (TPR) repeat protein